ncbi:MAG: Uma2 family endonuclease [Nitrospira sp.]|nr:Uma2 family endonuclease [Nitrospira sp.]
MSEFVIEETIEIPQPNVSQLITEDDTPVDNLFSAKQQRLLVEPLYSSRPVVPNGISWPFLADANVGIFRSNRLAPIVPDVFLSLEVEPAEDWYAKEHRSYFIWEFGKPPDVVIEVVSNSKGGEASKKLREYARAHISYYVIYDPQQLIQDEPVKVYELHIGEYLPKTTHWLEKVGLGLTLWQGEFEGRQDQWLRWCDQEGKVIPTGAELAEGEKNRANREQQRAERLAAQLRALGVEPEE